MQWHQYKVSFVLQVKSLRSVLIGLSTFIILFYLLTPNYRQGVTFELFFFVFLPIPLILFGPTIYLHLDYMSENYGVVLSTDPIVKTFEQYLGIYFRDRVDRAGRRIAP